MKRLVPMLLTWLAAAAPVHAQGISIPCGGAVTNQNASSALGTNGWLVYTVGTTVPPNVCVPAVAVEAAVLGVPNSSLRRFGVWSAFAQRQVPVPSSGVWVTVGSHFIVWGSPFSPVVLPAGLTQSQATVTISPPEPEDCSIYNGGGEYYVWDPQEEQCVVFMGTPIIVDTSREGYRLTSVNGGVLFDLDGDGQLEQVSWTHRNAENAFLAFDRNGNGTIDNGTELFGDHTPVSASGHTAPNGFEALRFFETSLDAKLTARDASYERLLLWTDRNHNGISEPDELQCLADAGVAAIDLNYKAVRRVDRFGNEFRQVAKLTWADGDVGKVFDVWLKLGR